MGYDLCHIRTVMSFSACVQMQKPQKTEHSHSVSVQIVLRVNKQMEYWRYRHLTDAFCMVM